MQDDAFVFLFELQTLPSRINSSKSGSTVLLQSPLPNKELSSGFNLGFLEFLLWFELEYKT